MLKSRYNRQTNLPAFGIAAQEKLQAAKILVVGAGGLGVPVLQYLAGMGVGTIGIMDGDEVQLSNLHRQVLYQESEIGMPKAETAAAKLGLLNSNISIMPINQALTPQNALEIIAGHDLVIDASDNFPTRYLINDACVILKKPFVYGAVQQMEGQVSVFNLDDGPTYRCLYPNMPSAGEIPDCNVAGVLGVTPGIVGCYMALEAVKVLTGIGQPLSGQLLTFDFLNSSQYKIKLKTNPQNKTLTDLAANYESPVCVAILNLSPVQLKDWLDAEKAFTLLDLRDEDDFEAQHLITARFFTTRALEKTETIPQHQPVVTVCYRGHRSLQAAQYLKEKYPELPVYHMAAGMDGWLTQIGDKHLEME